MTISRRPTGRCPDRYVALNTHFPRLVACVTIVAVKLTSGTPPSAVGRVCTMLAVFGTLTVGLDGPIGDRAVVSIT